MDTPKCLDTELLANEPKISGYTLVQNHAPDKAQFKKLQAQIMGPIIFPDKPGNAFQLDESLPLLDAQKNFDVLRQYMWMAILQDLRDPKIALATFKSEGHNDADTRINQTRLYFGGALKRFDLGDIVDYVNLVHELNGVVNRDAAKKPQSVEYYDESFMYVVSNLVERIRDYYQHELGIERNGREGKQLAAALCDLWYGVADRVGLHHRPATLEDHEAFVKAHEAAIIHDMEGKPKLRQDVQGMVSKMMPSIAKIAHCSEQDFANKVKEIRPELADFLGIDSRTWPTENLNPSANMLVTIGKRAAKSVKEIIAGKEPEDPILSALREAGNKDFDTGVRAVFHLARKRPDIRLERMQISLKPGEKLITEGQEPDYLYVLLNASAPLEVAQDQVKLATIPPGKPAIIGEIGMFRDVTTATVQAGRQGATLDVVRIPKAQFRDLLKEKEGLLLKRSLVPKMQARMHMNAQARSGFRKLEDADPAFRQIMSAIRELGKAEAGHDAGTFSTQANALQHRIVTYLDSDSTPAKDDAVAHYLVSVLWDLATCRPVAREQESPGAGQGRGH